MTAHGWRRSCLRGILRLTMVAGTAPLGCIVAAGSVAAQAAAATDTATVTYVSGRSIYVDAGERDGLREGSQVEILRDGRVIAVSRVVFLSPGRASCEIVTSSDLPRAGDLARYTARAASTPAADTPAADTAVVRVVRSADPRRPRRLAAGDAHGRIGVRYLSVVQRDSGTATLSQPAADLRIDAPAIGGTGLGLLADVRGRRTVSTGLDGIRETTNGSRVYHLSLSWNARGDGARLTAGRQFSEALSNVSLFDGVTAEWHQARWGTGAFAGTQPDPTDFGFSTAIREYGGFVQVRSPAGSLRRWSLTTGAIGSYDSGQVNREFAFLQFSFMDRRTAIFMVQEVDWNRGWKRDVGESAVAPTSTFLSARVRAGNAVSLHAGADNRRNVRLYRDRETPETEFDDEFRRGAWGGLSVDVLGHLHMGMDARLSDGASGSAQTYTASLGAHRLGAIGVSARTRSSRYRSQRAEGWLHSAAVGANPFTALHIELNGGLRRERTMPGVSSPSVTGETRVRWIGADADLALARSWYLLLSASRETGGWESNDQLYGTLSYRF